MTWRRESTKTARWDDPEKQKDIHNPRFFWEQWLVRQQEKFKETGTKFRTNAEIILDRKSSRST
ncbi:MAG: hypothetical protein EXS25_10220 [Pedosphaera sp.]|nr:hypothetical protein [Pedosphaera sp.]